MKRIVEVFCFLALLTSCKKNTESGRTAARQLSPTKMSSGATLEAEPEDLVAKGEALYNRYCALCHGEGGVGYAADDATQLSNSTFLESVSTPFLWLGIERGRPGTPMAAFGADFGGPFEREDFLALLEYLASLRGDAQQRNLESEIVSGEPEKGRALYEEHCQHCHGASGKGGPNVNLGNPYFLATASDGFVRHAIVKGRPGTPMPAFGGTLSEAQVNDLTSFIRSWAVTVDAESGKLVGETVPSVDQIVMNANGAQAKLGSLRDGRYVSAAKLNDVLASGARIVLLDARPTSDWFKSHIPGAFPAPFYDGIEPIEAALPRDGTWIVAYCACPHAASGKIVDFLRAAGFENTAVLDEGVLVWAEQGYPITIGKGRKP